MATSLQKRDGIAQPERWPELYRGLRGATSSRIRDDAQTLAVIFGDRQVLPEIRAVLADRSADLARREWALDNLVRVKDPEVVPVLHALLDDAKVRRKVIAGLGRFDDPQTAPLLVARFGDLDGEERQAAINSLTSRATYAKAFLTAVVGKQIAKDVLDSATTRRQIQALADAEIEALMTKAWGRSQPTSEDSLAAIARYKARLTPAVLEQADRTAGRAVYAKTCMVCHKLFGEGGSIGPDITGSNRADLDYILTNIIDPNAEVAKEYMLTMVETRDGGFFGGIVVEENEATIRLLTATGEIEQIARRNVAVGDNGKPAITVQPVSMMPVGQLLALQSDEVRDLIAYLGSEAQVPMRATAATLPRFFNEKDLSGWDADPEVWSVEDGALVGRTRKGLKQNNFARSHLTFGDFRLIVDVKLTGNLGNSGIQFRSAMHGEASMQGYQADIGTGWWGKLYEEHGRGTLVGTVRDQLVKPGEWNTYEILAVGHKLRTALNGVLCVDLDDPQGATTGILGVQVHSGGPTEVRFRNFRWELDPKFELETLRK
jgi:putative heme-binding domain-containing protein